MRILVGKISLMLVAGASIVFAQNAPVSKETGDADTGAAQTEAPAARASDEETVTPPRPANTPRTPPTGTDTSAALDYLFNQKPQEGTAGQQVLDSSQQAKEKAAADEAIRQGAYAQEFDLRFERYLNTPPVSGQDLDGYFASLQQVSEFLRENKPFDAWRILHSLAEYSIIDAGVSADLANRVESIWTNGKMSTKLSKRNSALQDDIRAANRNADMLSDSVMEKQIEYQRELNRQKAPSQRWQRQPQQQGTPTNVLPQAPTDSSSAPTIAGLEGKLQMTEEYLRSLELKAKIKLNELQQSQLRDQAKADFIEYINTLFENGRLNHVVIAADFYRKIFEEGEYPIEIAKKVNTALESDRDVDSSVVVAERKADRNQLTGASESLRHAFATNELNPSVLGLSAEIKEKISIYNHNVNRMRNMLEARDFASLEALVNEVKQTATDFDAAKPMAVVNAVKLESKMRLGKAKLAAQQGNLELAMDEFKAAAEAWPSNPDLEDNALTFFDAQDVKSQTTEEFDRLIAEENYRGIFDKQLAFAPAIHGDAKREEALKNALMAIKNAEVASEKANVLMMNGDFAGAWETIELASAVLKDDRKLNTMRADLASRSAEFVSAINKARDAEGRNEAGYSITCYVNAQRVYPASTIANEGIKRLSEKLLQAQL